MADLGARIGALLHPSIPGMSEMVDNGRCLTKVIAKWIGHVGAYLVGLGCPDVQQAPKEKVRVLNLDGSMAACQGIVLVDIPGARVRASQSNWQPKVLHCEARYVQTQVQAGDCSSGRR